MEITTAFDMDWLQNVLEINPVFSSEKICWSRKVNEILADSEEMGDSSWALLVLDSLSDYFSAKWGNVSSTQSDNNDLILKEYFNGNLNIGKLVAFYSSDDRKICIVTEKDFSLTIVMTSDECYGTKHSVQRNM